MISTFLNVCYISSSKKHFRDSFQAQIHANLAQNLIQLIALLLLVCTNKYRTQHFIYSVRQPFR